MHEKSTQESSDPWPEPECRNAPTTEREDAAIQRAVLALVLDRHPARLTLAELEREVAGDPAGFVQRDALARAVEDLVGAGLLCRHGDFVAPTRPAVHFERLESE